VRMTIAVFSLLSLAPSPLFAGQDSGAAAAQTDPKQTAVAPSYVRRFEDADFRDLNPAMSPGAQAAALWGDSKTGHSAVLFKMGRGATPLHFHTSTYHLVVVQGTMKHWVQGENEKDAAPLGPGSYWYIEGGKPHADSCLSEECIAFIRWDGRRDGHLLKSQ
jgi:quercetin dioxygenase-like cupin family protein